VNDLLSEEVPPGFAVLHVYKDEACYMKMKSVIVFGEGAAGCTWILVQGGAEIRVTESVATVAYLIRENGAPR